MILIKYFLDKSDVHGIGLFARENIKKGTIIYVPNDLLDIKLSKEEFKKLSVFDQKIIKHYGFLNSGVWHLAFDDIRFLNHSFNSNVTEVGGKLIAKYDIAVGEELLQDYREFEELREELKKQKNKKNEKKFKKQATRFW